MADSTPTPAGRRKLTSLRPAADDRDPSTDGQALHRGVCEVALVVPADTGNSYTVAIRGETRRARNTKGAKGEGREAEEKDENEH
jgi:hypothetical protein